MRVKFPLIVRASPPEGWSRGTVMVSENKVPYRTFCKLSVHHQSREFELKSASTRTTTQEYHSPCSKKSRSTARSGMTRQQESKRSTRPLPRNQMRKDRRFSSKGLSLLSSLLSRAGMFSFSSALVLSLYTNSEVQWEIAGLGLLDKIARSGSQGFHRPIFPWRYFEPGGARAGEAQGVRV